MTRTELQAKIELFGRELRALQAIPVRCTSCQHCTRDRWCDKFKAAPPDDVRAIGCEDWVYDEIPF
jgi:hypothetical protein